MNEGQTNARWHRGDHPSSSSIDECRDHAGPSRQHGEREGEAPSTRMGSRPPDPVDRQCPEARQRNEQETDHGARRGGTRQIDGEAGADVSWCSTATTACAPRSVASSKTNTRVTSFKSTDEAVAALQSGHEYALAVCEFVPDDPGAATLVRLVGERQKVGRLRCAIDADRSSVRGGRRVRVRGTREAVHPERASEGSRAGARSRA